MRPSSILLLLSLPALAACSSGSPDADGDLLSDEFEALIGTRRDLRDSDGDGFTDAEEHLSYYDATDRGDHPLENSYPRLALPEEIDAEGYAEGDISGSWEREDHLEQELRLHDFFGNVIVVAIMAEYVDASQDDAVDQQDAYDDHRDRGLMVFNVLVDGEPQDSSPDAVGWAIDFGLDFAVIDDEGQTLLDGYVDTEVNDEGVEQFTVPSYTVIDRNMVIRQRYNTDRFEPDLVEDLLDEPVPEVTTWPLPANAVEIREALGLRRFADDEANLDHKLVDADMNASLKGDLANGVQGNAFSPVDAEGNAAGQPFGGTTCDSAAGSFALFPLLLLPPLRRRR